jgi:monoterpene epsilon-lactone hydrolase
MKSPELEQLIAGLRAGGPDLSGSPQAARASFSAMGAAAPVAPDAAFSNVTLCGLRALQSLTPGARTDRTLLYLHGGAFVIGSPEDYRSLTAELGRAAGMRCLSLDYRLAPEHPFPAGVDDAVAAYRALLEGGTPPAHIAIAGDSAGGGLTLSLLVAARAAGLPMPGAAVLISPWVDLACTGYSMTAKRHVDPSLQRADLLSMAARYLDGRPSALPLASPLHADLQGLPPLLVQVGTAEILLSDALRLAEVAADADVRVTLNVWPDMIHVWHFFGFMLPEGRAALREAGDFLRDRLS